MAFSEERALEKMMKFMENYGSKPQLNIPRGNGKLSHAVAMQEAYINELSKPVIVTIDKESVKNCSEYMSSSLYKTYCVPIAHNLIKVAIYSMVNGGLPRNRLYPWQFAYHQLGSYSFSGRYALASPTGISADFGKESDSSAYQSNYAYYSSWDSPQNMRVTVPKPHAFGSFRKLHDKISNNMLNYDVMQVAFKDTYTDADLELFHHILTGKRFAGSIYPETMAYLKLITA